MTQPPYRPNPSPALVLAPFLERFVRGRRVAVLGDERSGLAEELLARGARLAQVHEPAPERGAGPSSFARRGPNVAPPEGGERSAREGAFDVTIVADAAAAPVPEALISRARRLTAPSGLVVVVTPNRGADDGAFGYYDLYDALSLQFSHVKMVGQVAFGGYALVDFGLEGEPDVAVDTSLTEAQGREAQYYVGLGSSHPLELEGYSIIELPGALASEAPSADLAALEKALERERASLAEALLGLQTERASSDALRESHRALEAKAGALAEANRALEARAGSLGDSHRVLEAKAGALVESHRALEARAGALGEANRALEARVGALVEKSREFEARAATIREAYQALEAKSEALVQARQSLEARAEALAQARQSLEARALEEGRRADAEARRSEALAQGAAELRAALQALELERVGAVSRAAQAVHDLQELRQRADVAGQQIAELSAQLTRARQALAASDEQRQRAQQREQVLARTIAELEARPRGVDPAEHQALREQLATAREQAAALRTKLAALEGELRARDEAHEVEVGEVEAQLRERARDLAQLRREVERRGMFVRELLDEREVALEGGEADGAGEALLRAKLEELAAELEQARAQVRDLSGALGRASSLPRPTPAEAADVMALRAELDALRRALLQERQERERLESERSAGVDPSAAVLLEQIAAERGAPG